jgi:type I restriction enzyme R subunit
MPAVNQNPEQIARDQIDRNLTQAGWCVQAKSEINFSAGPGIAIREYQTEIGPADYVLFVNKQAVGVIEAKPESWGQNLTTVEEQSTGYATAKLKWVDKAQPLPFIYESTGTITRFTDRRDPKPRSREVFTFHRPETMAEWLTHPKPLRARLHDLPTLNPHGLRDCQIDAVQNLEKSFQRDQPRALIQMATGSGKTFTAITSVYRLLKHANAKRILFLVDTRNLGEQAEQEFLSYLPNDDNRKFTELYNVQRLQSSYIPSSSQVVISTIQRMYAILKDEPLDDAAERDNPAERLVRPRQPLPVVYSPKLPPEFFDFIVIDECHRSIYNVWREVIEYFDAHLIGLTATPDNRTYGFFHKNVVSEYTHDRAIADGVNVGGETFIIDTQISTQGATLQREQQIEKRERLTRKKRWELQDDDEAYAATQLDRSVVNPDQIRTVLKAFRDSMPVIFPGREEVPKTLIFAKTDSHADDIIQITREVFAEGNDFAKKITYQSTEDPKSVLSQFRNNYNPRVAVTVDMIATGTDVKPLECLVFMRDVKSSNYFEQMKGRGTRTLDLDSLRKVTTSAITAKTHYVLVDAVGVTRSCKSPSTPLITKPSIPLKDLATGVMMGIRDEDTVSSLAGRLARLDRQLEPAEQDRIRQAAGGTALSTIVHQLLDSIDPDRIEQQASAAAGGKEPNEAQRTQARDKLVGQVANVFTGPLIDLIDNIRRQKEQTIDHDNLDTLNFAGFIGNARQSAENMARDFAAYLAEHRDQIEALSIFYTQPARRSVVTYAMIKAVMDALKTDRPRLAPISVWRAYALLDDVSEKNPVNDLTILVALIRRVCGIDTKLVAYDDTVRRNFRDWILKRHSGSGEKFTGEQLEWLHMIRDHIATSIHMEREDLENNPFDTKGGLGKMYQLFGGNIDAVLDELNEALAA